MIPRFETVEKREGETPLQALMRVRKVYPELKDLPLTYAGRLDPMATGLLLVLIGEECKRKDEYLALSKTYEFEVLFGASSDTGDILGIVNAGGRDVDESAVTQLADWLVGTHHLPYPALAGP